MTRPGASATSTRVEEALSGDAGLDGVRWLLGSSTIRGVLREALRGLLSEPRDLGRCLLRRAKFKPGRKLTAYYDVALADGRVNPRAIAVTWQPPGVASPVVDPKEDEMQAEAAAAGLAAPFGSLRGGQERLGMEVLVAPLDARFPRLVRASAPLTVRALMAGMGAERDGLQAAPVPPAYEVTAIRYRPGQRHVLRYVPVGADGRRQRRGTVFAKLYPTGESRSAATVAGQIADWLASADVGVSAVRPAGCFAEDDIVVYPRVVGTPLSRYSADRAGDHLARAGVGLRALQRAPIERFDEVQPHSFAGEVRAIARACEHIEALLPAAAAKIGDILERATALHERLSGERPRLAHGDYKADHAWVTRRGLTLIDFNTCSLADPALDVGKFLADIGWWYAASGEERLRWAQHQFLDGYGAVRSSERMLRARLYEVLIMTKITARRVRLFDAAWAAKTESLIARADGLLGELEHVAGGAGKGRGAAVRAGL